MKHISHMVIVQVKIKVFDTQSFNLGRNKKLVRSRNGNVKAKLVCKIPLLARRTRPKGR